WRFCVRGADTLELPDSWEGDIRVPFCLQAPLSGALDSLPAARLRELGLSRPPLAAPLRRGLFLWYHRRLPRLPAEWYGEDTGAIESARSSKASRSCRRSFRLCRGVRQRRGRGRQRRLVPAARGRQHALRGRCHPGPPRRGTRRGPCDAACALRRPPARRRGTAALWQAAPPAGLRRARAAPAHALLQRDRHMAARLARGRQRQGAPGLGEGGTPPRRGRGPVVSGDRRNPAQGVQPERAAFRRHPAGLPLSGRRGAPVQEAWRWAPASAVCASACPGRWRGAGAQRSRTSTGCGWSSSWGARPSGPPDGVV
ncbi:unnamed protein product, partial [Prorocentrum cordatum]